MEREIKKLINKIVSEEFSGRISKVKKQLLENEGETCECGGMMYEGECMECGKMYEGNIQELGGMDDGHPRFGKKRFKKDMSIEDIEKLLRGDDEEEDEDEIGHHMGHRHHRDEHNDDEFDFVELDLDENELEEKLFGNQTKLDKNKNGRLDREDFKMLRKNKHETDEAECMECGDTYEDQVEETYYRIQNYGKTIFTEDEMIDIIEKIIKEETKYEKGKVSGSNTLKSSLNKSGKEESDYIEMVTKKMKEYLKDGSKGKYEANPKHFPKGNGELEEMEKMAYIPSKAVKDFTKNLTAAALENIDYDGIAPDEEWVTDNIEGSSRTGNNPDWANAVETDVNKDRNQIRKDNWLAKVKKKAYNKSPQPVVNDTAGHTNDKSSEVMMKLESIEDKKVISEMEKMKNLIGYNQKTQ